MLYLFFTFFDMSLSLKQDCNDKVKTNGAFQPYLSLSLSLQPNCNNQVDTNGGCPLTSTKLQQLGGYECWIFQPHLSLLLSLPSLSLSLQRNCNAKVEKIVHLQPYFSLLLKRICNDKVKTNGAFQPYLSLSQSVNQTTTIRWIRIGDFQPYLSLSPSLQRGCKDKAAEHGAFPT